MDFAGRFRSYHPLKETRVFMLGRYRSPARRVGLRGGRPWMWLFKVGERAALT